MTQYFLTFPPPFGVSSTPCGVMMMLDSWMPLSVGWFSYLVCETSVSGCCALSSGTQCHVCCTCSMRAVCRAKEGTCIHVCEPDHTTWFSRPRGLGIEGGRVYPFNPTDSPNSRRLKAWTHKNERIKKRSWGKNCLRGCGEGCVLVGLRER